MTVHLMKAVAMEAADDLDEARRRVGENWLQSFLMCVCSCCLNTCMTVHLKAAAMEAADGLDGEACRLLCPSWKFSGLSR